MRSSVLTASVAASICLLPAAAFGQHWSYHGDDGPAHWGDLSEDWAACSAGQQQSPIDISGAYHAHSDFGDIDWVSEAPASVVDNGHTIQANLNDAGGIGVGGTEYRLLQFHFHAASEHTIDGEHAPLEVHFVHASEDGNLAVIGVLFEEGEAHPVLDAIWESAPDAAGGDAGEALGFDLSGFLPEDRDHFRYQGSLTTPPCSEIVSWIVYEAPISASSAQIEAFASRFPGSFRPVQALNRRFILQTGH